MKVETNNYLKRPNVQHCNYYIQYLIDRAHKLVVSQVPFLVQNKIMLRRLRVGQVIIENMVCKMDTQALRTLN